MPPELRKYMPTIAKVIESAAMELIVKAAKLAAWGLVLWGIWSIKNVASSYVDHHPTVLQLKAEVSSAEAEVAATKAEVAADKAAVAQTQNTVAQIADNLGNLRREMSGRFDKQDAASLRLQERIDRHMEASTTK